MRVFERARQDPIGSEVVKDLLEAGHLELVLACFLENRNDKGSRLLSIFPLSSNGQGYESCSQCPKGSGC